MLTNKVPSCVILPNPQPKQRQAMMAKKKIVIFGGARGGGKSMFIRIKSVSMALKWAGICIVIIRRTYPELKENHIDKIKKMCHVGLRNACATYNSTDKELKFTNGSVILFRACDNENALTKVQGQEYDVEFIDEAANFPEDWLKKMHACLRGANGYPHRIYMTCNPSGIGMAYIKRVAIDKHYEDGEDPDEYEFIQSLLTDNIELMKKDPDYIKRLQALPPKLRKAWLEGRWDVFEGAYFEEFRVTPDMQKCYEAGITDEEALVQHRWTHVIEPFEIPKDWKIYRSYDYGYGKPFSVGWWAVDYDDIAYRILELYGCTDTPNEGIHWTFSQQMKRIAEIEQSHPWLAGKQIYGVADPAIWQGEMGIPNLEAAEKAGVYFNKGVNDRLTGWMQVRERMWFDENGFARMYFFNTCKAIIRCMPLMMYDEHNVEDLDTDLEDHCLDDTRYFAMCRAIPPRMIKEEKKPMLDPLNQFKR